MRESELLTSRECQETFEALAREARRYGVQDVELMLGATSSAVTRFANNTIHQNVAERARWMSVRVQIDQRTARASTNRFDAEAIRAVIEDAVAITRSQAPDPELLPLAEPADYPHLERYSRFTAQLAPQERAAAVSEAIRVIEGAKQVAAGAYSSRESVEAILNSHGVFAYYCDTLASCSITAMAENSSGWAKQSSPDREPVDPPALATRAMTKARLAADPIEMPPGRYTVVLEPSAVLDLVGQMFPDFSATALHDQRSFLTGRLGQKLFGANISIYDDVCHPLQSGPAFDGEGVLRKRLVLVEKGVPRQIAYSRQAARRDGVEPTGHGFPLPNEYGEAPVNIAIEGGDRLLEEMIAATERGVLVTRLWYIREVDPYAKIMTGMTRDGTFLIQDGKIERGLKNFRFNQGLIELLSNVEALSAPVRAAGEEAFDMVVPAMKVRDFHFTEVTRF